MSVSNKRRNLDVQKFILTKPIASSNPFLRVETVSGVISHLHKIVSLIGRDISFIVLPYEAGVLHIAYLQDGAPWALHSVSVTL